MTANHNPLPEVARGPEIPEKGYLVEEIRDGLYWVTDGAFQTMFLVYDRGVVAVDAPPFIGQNYPAAIAEVTDKPVTHLVYSHAHTDHIGAARVFPEDVAIIAHQETANILGRMNDAKRPMPAITFDDGYELRVGDKVLQLRHHGPNHSPDNTFIYAPEQKALMLVDVIFPGWVPFKNLAMAQDVPGFVAAHDQVLGYDFEAFVGGHLSRLGDRQDVLTQKEYVLDVQAAAGRALESVDLGEFVRRYGRENPYRLFDAYQDAVADAGAQEVLAKWDDRLGAADVYTQDHCWMMSQSLTIDY